MRFGTRYDTWLVALIAAIGLIVFGLPVFLYAKLSALHQPTFLLLIGPLIYIAVLSAILPQYYELRPDGLYIRQGWTKALLPYARLRELRQWSSALSAPVFSTHRLLVTAVPSGQFILAVADEKRFLTEVASRAPQLQTGSAGLVRSGNADGKH